MATESNVFDGPFGGSSSAIINALGYTPADASKYLPLAGGTMVGDLKFADATYDIGKSGATRPRNIFVSGTGAFGGTITGPDTGTWATAGIQTSGYVRSGGNMQTLATYIGHVNASLIKVDTNGKFTLSNNAANAGWLFDGTTDGLMKVRNRADSAYAAIRGQLQADNTLVTGLTPATAAGLLTKSIILYDVAGNPITVYGS